MKSAGLLLLLGLFSSAQAAEVTVLGGLNYAAPSQKISNVGQNWTGDEAAAYGALIGDSLFNTPLELETGILFLNEKYEQPGATNTTTTRTAGQTQLPILLRWNFDQWFSLGVGGYFAWARGARDSTLSSSDQGLLGSLRAKFYISTELHFLLDARYQHGLSNQALIAGDSFNTRSIEILAGFGYNF